MRPSAPDESFLRECRLLLEEVCCNVGRFHLAEKHGVEPGSIGINQEVDLGRPGCFADIRLTVTGKPPSFVEVKYGYAPTRALAHLQRKYGELTALLPSGSHVIVVIDAHRHADRAALEQGIRDAIHSDLTVEIWDEARMLAMLRERFGLKLEAITAESAFEIREAFDEAKGRHAFGDAWNGGPLQSSLLWHFGFWRLGGLLAAPGRTPETLLPAGNYRGVVVILADLCSFSAYVRDTRDDEVIRYCLSSFYAKARYEILNTGGMLYQFVGDEVIGFYGLPDQPADYLESALTCARALVQIGDSISNEWQRQIDRVQQSRGVHIGIAIGDVQVLGLQPFGRARVSAISDAINLGARLLSAADSGEIVVSNSFYKNLPLSAQTQFKASETIEAKNLGRINAWRLSCRE